MHVKEAKLGGEREASHLSHPGLEGIAAFFGKRKGRIRLTKAITELSLGHPSDELLEQVRTHFDDRELTNSTWRLA